MLHNYRVCVRVGGCDPRACYDKKRSMANVTMQSEQTGRNTTKYQMLTLSVYKCMHSVFVYVMCIQKASVAYTTSQEADAHSIKASIVRDE
jgi:hypothetical protein